MAGRTESIRRTVLVVEDELVNSQLLGFILSEEYNVLYAEDGRKALEVLRSNIGAISMVLTDIKMPVMDGFELIKEIRADKNLGMIPIMVLTSESTYEEQSLDLGAIDFLTKPYDMPSIIKARVRRIIELSEGRTIIKATEKDYLTGLYAREFFFEYAGRLLSSGQDRQLDAVVIDLDRFNVINELYGRIFGNLVLKGIADSLLAQIGGSGIASRFENDIFYVLCDHRDSYELMAQNICNDLSILNSSIRFSVRIGIQTDVSRNTSLLQQFETARSACNSIRSDKLHSVAFYNEEMHKKKLLEERLLNEMQQALDEHQFVVWYQPKFNIRGDKPVLCSSEALVRWKHPELGMVSPGVFIPLFEHNALIQKLDLYVWKEAARQVAQWKVKYGASIPVSVNVSRIDLFDSTLKQTLTDILKENRLSFDDFLLEVTESAYSDNASQIIEAIRDLGNAGFRIEMDDFGTGYSSLNNLSEMPLDIIKLDMSFTRKIHENKTTLRVVELIVEMARSLGFVVVAEGVENETQYQLLRQVGCDCVQGYYFSRPLPAADFEAFVETRLQDLEVKTR